MHAEEAFIKHKTDNLCKYFDIIKIKTYLLRRLSKNCVCELRERIKTIKINNKID